MQQKRKHLHSVKWSDKWYMYDSARCSKLNQYWGSRDDRSSECMLHVQVFSLRDKNCVKQQFSLNWDWKICLVACLWQPSIRHQSWLCFIIFFCVLLIISFSLTYNFSANIAVHSYRKCQNCGGRGEICFWESSAKCSSVVLTAFWNGWNLNSSVKLSCPER